MYIGGTNGRMLNTFLRYKILRYYGERKSLNRTYFAKNDPIQPAAQEESPQDYQRQQQTVPSAAT